MLAALRHRGPDGEGTWAEDGVWLGHRRLAVVDLSTAGDQPMISACGRYVLVLNGEIYNYETLRAEVNQTRRRSWRGHSDTEVLLEAMAAFGVSEAITLAEGMFAFALWDRSERRLWLGRDRLGEKPLYYAIHSGGLTFASEVSALEKAADLGLELNGGALSLYFRLGYVPGDLAIYDGVRKILPGTLLSWRVGQAPQVTSFWSVDQAVREGRAATLHDPDQAADKLDGLLRQVVSEQRLADVPVGVFLSGGIDSSLIAGVMQAVSDQPVRTFTMGFDVAAFNEADHARAVAAHLGTSHTEHIVTAADAMTIVPTLGRLCDEPFADASQIPTLLISKMARQHVTVCLTGDGGDEMFGGYVRYPGVPRLWRAIRGIPFRGASSRMLESLPLSALEGGLKFLGPLAETYAARGKLGPALRKVGGWLAAKSEAELYELTMTAWSDPQSLFLQPPEVPTTWRPASPRFETSAERMMWRDMVDYLPGDILCKVDRAAMTHSLETRAPLLDRRVAAFAWRAPLTMKIKGHQGKWLLRQVLDRYVPRTLIDRPKLGFSVPLHDWLSGPLRDWAEALLDPTVLGRQSLLDPVPIRKAWAAYLDGDSSLNHRIWTVLMFQAWMEARGR